MKEMRIHRCLEEGQNLLERAAETLQNAPSGQGA